MKITTLLRWGLVVCLAVLVGCQEQPQAPVLEVPQALLQQTSAQQAGAGLFRKHCRECHGSMSEGRNPRAARFVPPAPDFYGEEYRSIDPAYLYWRIAEGKRAEPFRSQGSVMPAWQPHLSREQIWQLVAYLRQRAGMK